MVTMSLHRSLNYQTISIRAICIKVKTFKEITKLERNGMFVYESVPGTAVFNLTQSEAQMDFHVEGPEDAQITVEMEPDTEYEVFIEQASTGKMKTNLGG